MARTPLPIGAYGRISARKVSTTAWQATTRFRDHDGIVRPVAARGRTRNIAENALKAKLAERATPTGGEDLNSETTISALADLWLDEISSDEERKPSTIEGYRVIIDRSVRKQLGAVRLREATTGRLDRHVKSFMAAGKKSEARHVKVVLSLMFDLAVRHDACRVNPARAVTRVAKPKPQPRALTIADVPNIYDLITSWTRRDRPGPKVNDDLAHTVLLHLATGCRIGEVLATRWEDVADDGESVWLVVSGTLIQPKSKGGGSVWRQDTTKGGPGRRLLLPPFAAELLRDRRDRLDGEPTGPVFPTRNATWKAPNNVRRQWRAARKGSAYEWVTPHTLRKTVATAIDEAADTKTAAEQLGHSSEAITNTYYIETRDAVGPDVRHVLEQFAPRPGQEQNA